MLHDPQADATRLLIRTGVQADRIGRLTAALRDSRRKLAAANERQAMLEDRSASLTWRIADRVSRRASQIAPRGSKRRSLIRFGFRALRGVLRMGSREFMAGRLSSFTERLSATIPGRMDWHYLR